MAVQHQPLWRIFVEEQEVQTVREEQLRHVVGQATQLLELERKLEVPQLRQVEGLFFEQVPQDWKHFVQLCVPTIFTQPALQAPLSHLPAPATPQLSQLAAHCLHTPAMLEYPRTQAVAQLTLTGQATALGSAQPWQAPPIRVLEPQQEVQMAQLVLAQVSHVSKQRIIDPVESMAYPLQGAVQQIALAAELQVQEQQPAVHAATAEEVEELEEVEVLTTVEPWELSQHRPLVRIKPFVHSRQLSPEVQESQLETHDSQAPLFGQYFDLQTVQPPELQVMQLSTSQYPHLLLMRKEPTGQVQVSVLLSQYCVSRQTMSQHLVPFVSERQYALLQTSHLRGLLLVHWKQFDTLHQQGVRQQQTLLMRTRLQVASQERQFTESLQLRHLDTAQLQRLQVPVGVRQQRSKH